MQMEENLIEKNPQLAGDPMGLTEEQIEELAAEGLKKETNHENGGYAVSQNGMILNLSLNGEARVGGEEVVEEEATVEELTSETPEVTIMPGESVRVKAEPSGFMSIAWYSSDESVAVVNTVLYGSGLQENGLAEILGVGEGTATVTASTSTGVKCDVEVTVSKEVESETEPEPVEQEPLPAEEKVEPEQQQVEPVSLEAEIPVATTKRSTKKTTEEVAE